MTQLILRHVAARKWVAACLGSLCLHTACAQPAPAPPAEAPPQAPKSDPAPQPAPPTPPTAQPAAQPESTQVAAASQNSRIDAPLFYQLLIGEIELRAGNAGNAYAVILDAARRTRDEQLFRRATEIALRARAGEQALAATQAWRSALPESTEAMQLQLQILLSMNRLDDLGEPMRALIDATPLPGRPALIASLPRFMQRAAEKRRAAEALQSLLQPYIDDPATRVAAEVAAGRMWLAAGDAERAESLLRRAHAADPTAHGPALLALELMGTRAETESIVLAYLARPSAEVAMRRAYASVLINAQRYNDAMAQLEIVTREQPDLAPAWLTLGALRIELRQPQDAEAALQRYLQLAQAPGAASVAPAAAATDAGEVGDDGAAGEKGLTQAWLLLAQAAEQRGDFAAAEAWLARIDSPQRALEVQTRRASLLARQGRLDEARELLRKAPERGPEDARAKLLAEAQLLRQAKMWQQTFDLLAGANQRFPDDADLLYEQAMAAEKVEQLETMELLLRRVIALKPEHAHAYNALGYSLADRKLRLDEAKELIQRALAISPGDPFITDSLGWVEFRLGDREEALRLLRSAYKTRPDAEIAAHLGEVLWAMGREDEARQVWAEGRERDATNDVLRETLQRLKVEL